MKRLLPVTAFLFLLFSALLALVGTEPGTRLLFRGLQVLHPPLSVQKVEGTLLKSLQLRGVRYQSPELRLHGSSVLLRWQPRALWRRRLQIQRIELNGLTLELAARPATEQAVTLPEIGFPVPVVIEHLVVRRLTIRRPEAEAVGIDTIDLGLALAGHELRLQRAELRTAGFAFHGHGRVRMQARYPVSLQFGWRFRSQFRGDGKIQGDLGRLTLNHRTTAPFTVTTAGTLTRILERPGIDLRGGWRQIHWPLKHGPRWQARQGRYRLHGTPADYRLSLTTTLSGPRLPPTRLRLRSQGDLQGFRHFDLRAEGKAGALDASGEIHWGPEIGWNVALVGNHIDPGWWRAEWPGDLQLTARCGGRLAPGLETTLDLERLQGRLRGHPLEARGRLIYRDHRLETERLDLSWGDNRLQLHGVAARERLDLGFQLHAPRLDVLTPELAGDLSGQGRIHGSPDRPRVRLSLRGHRLRWADRVSLKRLSLEARAHPGDPDSRLRLRLSLLQLQRWRFDQVRLSASGRLAAHRLRLEAGGPLGRVLLTAGGSYRPGKTASWEGRIVRLPLTLLQPLAPGETSVTGDIEAHFSYRQWPGGRRGQLQWRLPKAAVSAAIEGGRRLSLELRDGRGLAVLENRHLQAELLLPFPGQGSIEAGLAADLATRRTEGRARVDFTRLHLVEILSPQLREVSGRLHGRLRLTGTWEHPVVGVDLRVEDAGAQVIPLGIQIQQSRLQIIGETGKPIAIQGRLRSGPGYVSIRGEAFLEPRLSISLRLSGDRFEAVSLPRARILVSPLIAVQADDEAVRVTGTVHLPQADIRLKKTLFPEQSPEMVSVSEDEIVIGHRPESRRRRLKVLSRIQLTLGENVHFQGYGLEAGLKGKLSLTTKGTLTTAEGVIHLVDGRFTAYGQKLKIDLGRIIFSGPVGNPAFDIRIARHVRRDDVTVTLRITGFADDPRLSLASEPPLPEEDAIAYLIAGRPLTRLGENGENGARAAVTKALASLGVSYLNRLGLEKIARVEFSAGSLVLGKYLTAELYVGYAVDIFTGIGEVLLRYELTPRVHVEVRSGESQSVDVFYHTRGCIVSAP